MEMATEGIAGLHPAYFALVMATGIVSIGCHLLGFTAISWPLFALNVASYAVLWGLTLVRIVRYRSRVIADLLNHGRSVGFFTIVAATCMLGSDCLLIADSVRAARALWCFGIALWIVLTYSIFTIITVKSEKPAFVDGINGGWLVSVVAAQSVSLLGSQLAPGFGEHTDAVLLFALVTWLGGCMLYLWIISLIFYRYTFFVMSPDDLAPPYWINMGAAAISTLAGCMLVLAEPHSAVLGQILPFVRGFTLFWWATATWWIPMLVILGIWRHVVRRFPLRYDPLYWGAVFPIGMYTVSTFRLSSAVDAPYLASISSAFIYVALAGWAITALGMSVHVLGRLRTRSEASRRAR